ncbi:MAG: FeoB-associated Cys-rich membrane protein [Pseudomonadota bacterium]
MKMNEEIIVALVVLGAVIYVLKKLLFAINQFKSGRASGNGCSGCSKKSKRCG